MCNEDPRLLLFRASHDSPGGGVGGAGAGGEEQGCRVGFFFFQT